MIIYCPNNSVLLEFYVSREKSENADTLKGVNERVSSEMTSLFPTRENTGDAVRTQHLHSFASSARFRSP